MPAHDAPVPPIIAIEGLDGAGKTAAWKQLRRDPAFTGVHFTAEFFSPVGTAIKNDPGWRADVHFKLFAFAADRAWLIREIRSLSPAPAAVVWDRYIDSAIAYRGAEFDLRRSAITAEWTTELNAVFPPAARTLYFELPIDAALRRTPGGDRDLLEAVEAQYRALRSQAGAAYITIDASRPLDQVVAQVKDELRHAIKQLSA